MTVQFEEWAAATGRQAPALEVSGWSIDSRTLEPGDVFFALRGPSHDGHDFVEAAAQRGAAAVVVERTVAAGVPSMVVDNTLEALQSLGRFARRRVPKVVAVTGSAGKTSTKDAVAALLSVGLATGKTSGNFNNLVGVPLSILRLPDSCDAAVLEMGMNHAGEIRELCAIAQPEIGVVTNVGWAHAENFEDGIEGITRAKRELIESLPESGVAVLNADDERVADFRRFHAGRTVTFGLGEGAEVRAADVELGVESSRFRACDVRFELPLAGVHSLRNALAGIAVAGVLGIAPERLVDAVRGLVPGRMRGERIQFRGATLIDDCYNANPEAVRSMIDVLGGAPAMRRIAVLGEMLELGREAGPLHRAIGSYVAASGIDVLIGIRGEARRMVDQALEDEMPGPAIFFDDPEAAGDYVRRELREGDAVLFKGSRGVAVERALRRVLGGEG